MGGRELDSLIGKRSMVGSYKHDYEPSGSTEVGEFLD
jgi:hypothetical protein